MDIKPRRKRIQKKIETIARKPGAGVSSVAKRAQVATKGRTTDQEAKVPKRVTNATLDKHRREILGSAQRFIYPLSHSRHKVALISASLFIFLVLLTFALTAFLLYRYQRVDDFTYRVAQIVPFPVARVEGRFVSFEDYLFEVRQNVHFYTNQENIDLNDKEGRAILANIRAESLQRVKENALAKKLAGEQDVTVTPEEVQEQIAAFREQGGVSSSGEAFANTLEEYYGWELDDLERVLSLQLLKQKLVTTLDATSLERATEARDAARAEGADFAKIASKYTEDQITKEGGGQLGLVSKSDTELPTQFIDAAFGLEKGGVSGLVQTPFGYHVIKLNDVTDDDQRDISHIFIAFRKIEDILAERLKDLPVTDYITPKNDASVDEDSGESRPQEDDAIQG